MNEVETEICENCGDNIFLHKDGERLAKYENLKGTIQHSVIRCEINQIISKKFREIEVEIKQLKERVGLE